MKNKSHKLHSQGKQMGRKKLKEPISVRKCARAESPSDVVQCTTAVGSEPLQSSLHTPEKLCIFYRHKKCNRCNLCGEIEKPGFGRKFEAGKINKPLKKGQKET